MRTKHNITALIVTMMAASPLAVGAIVAADALQVKGSSAVTHSIVAASETTSATAGTPDTYHDM